MVNYKTINLVLIVVTNEIGYIYLLEQMQFCKNKNIRCNPAAFCLYYNGLLVVANMFYNGQKRVQCLFSI